MTNVTSTTSNQSRAYDEDGNIVTVGDFVGFKTGSEMSGEVTAIRGGELFIKVWDDNTCEYKEYWQYAKRCWAE